MNIRLQGTEEECREMAGQLPRGVSVLSVSRAYANRDSDSIVRVFAEVRIPEESSSAANSGGAARTPRELADQAAEAIRALNHVTPGALEYPADAYETVANLKILAMRLPQAFEQIWAYLKTENAAGRIVHDRGEDPGPYVDEAGDSLMLAELAANSLYAALDTVHNSLSGLKSAR